MNQNVSRLKTFNWLDVYEENVLKLRSLHYYYTCPFKDKQTFQNNNVNKSSHNHNNSFLNNSIRNLHYCITVSSSISSLFCSVFTFSLIGEWFLCFLYTYTLHNIWNLASWRPNWQPCIISETWPPGGQSGNPVAASWLAHAYWSILDVLSLLEIAYIGEENGGLYKIDTDSNNLVSWYALQVDRDVIWQPNFFCFFF